MFRTKKFMSTAGIVFVFLGMVLVFQPDEAEADWSTPMCALMYHRSFGMPMEYRTNYINTVVRDTNCEDCLTHPQTYPHLVARYDKYARTREKWEHFMIPIPWWSLCHIHYGNWFYIGIDEITSRCNRGDL